MKSLLILLAWSEVKAGLDSTGNTSIPSHGIYPSRAVMSCLWITEHLRQHRAEQTTEPTRAKVLRRSDEHSSLHLLFSKGGGECDFAVGWRDSFGHLYWLRGQLHTFSCNLGEEILSRPEEKYV